MERQPFQGRWSQGRGGPGGRRDSPSLLVAFLKWPARFLIEKHGANVPRARTLFHASRERTEPRAEFTFEICRANEENVFTGVLLWRASVPRVPHANSRRERTTDGSRMVKRIARTNAERIHSTIVAIVIVSDCEGIQIFPGECNARIESTVSI